MRRHTLRSAALAWTLALSGAAFATSPALASCIPLDTMLPDAATPGQLVFLGTVTGSDALHTQLIVDAWYLGDAPTDLVIVVGGRQIGTISSVDWNPAPGEQFIVVAERSPEGSLLTGTCQQSAPYPQLLGTLLTRYGDAQLPPFAPSPSGSPTTSISPAPSAVTSGESPDPSSLVDGSPVVTSNESPLPGSLVHGSPTPSPASA